jgi:hypothetical protein
VQNIHTAREPMGILNLSIVLTSDPDAWLRSSFAELAHDHTSRGLLV